MKTNLGIETTDPERLLIGKALGVRRMATRNDIREAINSYVEKLKTGVPPSVSVERQRDEGTVQAPADEPHAEPARKVDFVSSRGDEPYLYRGKDPELTAACSAVLDACERLDEVIWHKLEANREGAL